MDMAMNDEKTYHGFLKFVHETATNNPSCPVDHDLGWSDCAAGDYLSFNSPDIERHSFDFIMVTLEFSKDLEKENKNLYIFLGSEANNTDHGTYKELWEAVQEYL